MRTGLGGGENVTWAVLPTAGVVFGEPFAFIVVLLREILSARSKSQKSPMVIERAYNFLKRGWIKTEPRPLTVSNHRIGSSAGFSGVLEIDARLERIRSQCLIATNSALSGKIF
jgi:hypothetical protein